MTDIEITLRPGDEPTFGRTDVKINGVICRDILSFNVNRSMDRLDTVTITFSNLDLQMNHEFTELEVGHAATWREHYEIGE